MRPHPNDLAVGAVTLCWDLAADLAPEPSRRRRARAVVTVLGTAALLWTERESLAEARDALRSLRELRQRIADATTEEELDTILAEADEAAAEQKTAPDTARMAGTAALVVGSLAAEIALRRVTKHRIAAGDRLPRLPAALARAAMALVVGPATRALEQPSRN